MGNRFSLNQVGQSSKKITILIKQLAVRRLERIGASLGTGGEGGRRRFKLRCWSSDDIRASSDSGTSSSELSSSEHSILENLGSEDFKGARGLVKVEALISGVGASRFLSKIPFSGKAVVVSAST